MLSNKYFLFYLSLVCAQVSCTKPHTANSKLLQLVDPDVSGIYFQNNLNETLENNVLTYSNFYNGAGVALGDVNNDGLLDIYLNANDHTGKLYLNQGNLSFKNITAGSGLDTISGWKTGVSMVDINQDGLLDIYICRSGRVKPRLRGNLLYINNGNQTFTESARAFGLDSWSTSTQASFFDYDLDGDLDMFLLNHNIDPEREIFKNFHDKDISRFSGDQLFRNEDGVFREVEAFVGIKKSKLGDGLGICTSDFNQDGFPDLYVCNDFVGRDYLYFNKGDGTFEEKAINSLRHLSYSSMGVDAADIDNDGWQDIFVLDMRSSTNYGRKTNMASMDPEAFTQLVGLSGLPQYMQNTLQLNNGNGTFSDIAPLAGLSTTDWSWAPLFIDIDNDGWQDLFVTNGMKKNTNNKDFISYKETRAKQEFSKANPDHVGLAKEILAAVPMEHVANYVYKNNGGLSFAMKNDDWGVELPTFSNGAAYGDLDNDGDMDLVINNIDEGANLYKNNASELLDNHFIRISLEGAPENRLGIGSKIMLYAGGMMQLREQFVSRGYQSSVDHNVHFGIGQHQIIDSIKVIWPDKKISKLENIPADQRITINHMDHQQDTLTEGSDATLFEDVTEDFLIKHCHQENDYDDFEREVLLPHKMSAFGPALAVGDINRDGLEDFFVGGAKDAEGAIYLQNEDGFFVRMTQLDISADQFHEDIDALFFDADQDGDKDLYVVSGGNELAEDLTYYQDRLYLNDGAGAFSRSDLLPRIGASGGVVRASDFDRDGDLDLFVGGRLVPGKYPLAGRSYLMENIDGKFVDVTSKHDSTLMYPGMVTDALWSDFDVDGSTDLVLVGEWMPITIFKNNGGLFKRMDTDSTLSSTAGWWFSVTEADVNKDGRPDYLLGNLGENYKYKAKIGSPFRLYSKDFDENGALDIVLSYYEDSTLFPVRGKQCSSQQIPDLKEKFHDYHSFGLATLGDIYDEVALASSNVLEAEIFSSGILLNTADGFTFKSFPPLAQISATFAIVYDDFDDDGVEDIVIAGNLYQSEIETPRADAGNGLFLKGDGGGEFSVVRGYRSGLWLQGDVKKLKSIQLGPLGNRTQGLLAGLNNDFLKLIAISAGTGRTELRL